MNKLTTLFTLILMFSMLSACSTPMRDRATLPSFKLTESTLTRILYVKDNTAVPIEPTLSFSVNDSEAISYVKLKNLTGKHRLRWDWIEPKGGLYSSSGDYGLNAPKGRYREEVVAWHRLSIRGDRASHLPGEWQIRVYLDDALIVQRAFTIQGEKSGEAH